MTRHSVARRPATDRLEVEVLQSIDVVLCLLDRALALLGDAAGEYRRAVVPATGATVTLSDLHARVLEALTPATPAPELPLVAALFHVTQCLQRMREQCVLLATLVPALDERLAPNDAIREQIELVGELTRTQVARSKTAFRSGDVELVEGLLRRDVEVKRAGRKVFDRALDGGVDDRSRAASLLMVMILSCLEELDDNAIEIGEQAEILSALGR